MPLQIGEERARNDDREDDAGRDEIQRRLDDEPPEALPVRMEQCDAVRLQDRPHDPGGRNERPDQRDRLCADIVLAEQPRW